MSGHDVICLGEALVDFLPDRRGQKVRDVARWTPCLGGAPANVTVGVSRLGGESALVGVTGDDEFGYFLRQGLEREGVDTSFLRHTHEGRTGLAFLSLTRSGERSFTFYRTRAAETFLDARDTSGAAMAIARARVLHVGTNSLLQPKARAAVKAAVRRSFQAGRITSSDPNLRLHLWPDPDVLRGLLDELIPMLAVVKLSDEEIHFVTGTKDVDEALGRLEARGVALAVVTCGAAGAAFRFGGQTRRVPAPRVKVVDTTGAGDGFTSGLLAELSRLAATRHALERLPMDDVEAMARLGCVVGAHAVTKLGAVAGLPRRKELTRWRR
ncbi:MAG: carbohydrate kinase [Myxococcaceae bacterium]|nr:carbohydrate kinase [Myxococcaceae bacterium]